MLVVIEKRLDASIPEKVSILSIDNIRIYPYMLPIVVLILIVLEWQAFITEEPHTVLLDLLLLLRIFLFQKSLLLG